MRKATLKVTSSLVGLGLAIANYGCSSDDDDDEVAAVETAAAGSTTVSASTSGLGVSNLAAIPDLDSFLKSKSTTAGLALVTGTPPKFTDIAGNMTTYLTGDVTTLGATIETYRQNTNWTAMKAELGKFLEAEAKCATMEHTARIVQRLKEDSAPLCLLKAVGPVGDKVFKVASGTAISDLTTVFKPTAEDKVLQIGLTDKGQKKYEIVQITGTTNNPNGYKIVYSTCITATKKAFRQNTIDINNTTGVVTVKSYKHGAIDDKGVKPNATFTMSGYVVADGVGGVTPDTSKARTVNYAMAGTLGTLNSSNQGALTISSNELAATFFSSESGTDKGGNTIKRSLKTALNVQYTGSSTTDLVIYQGAGRSVTSFEGTNPEGAAFTISNDQTTGLDFNNTLAPQYTTVTSSTYLTSVAAVDFSADVILKQTIPTDPDMELIDSAPCSATPTTVLAFVDKPEDNTTYSAALASCNSFPAEKSVNMCDDLRNQSRTVNNAMRARKVATGSTKD